MKFATICSLFMRFSDELKVTIPECHVGKVADLDYGHPRIKMRSVAHCLDTVGGAAEVRYSVRGRGPQDSSSGRQNVFSAPAHGSGMQSQTHLCRTEYFFSSSAIELDLILKLSLVPTVKIYLITFR